MAVKGCWPRAIFYDSKTTLFDPVLPRPVDGMPANRADTTRGIPADFEVETLHDVTRIVKAIRGA
jgi:hypothetical protein